MIELIVVVAMLSIILFFSIPKFQGGILPQDSGKTVRWLMNNIQLQKQYALRNQKQFAMHIDVDSRKIWISDESMTDEQKDEATRKAYSFPDDIDIDVIFPDNEPIRTGTAIIRFYKNGYSDKAIIHIEDDADTRISLLLEPFLPRIKVYDDLITF